MVDVNVIQIHSMNPDWKKRKENLYMDELLNGLLIL